MEQLLLLLTAHYSTKFVNCGEEISRERAQDIRGWRNVNSPPTGASPPPAISSPADCRLQPACSRLAGRLYSGCQPRRGDGFNHTSEPRQFTSFCLDFCREGGTGGEAGRHESAGLAYTELWQSYSARSGPWASVLKYTHTHFVERFYDTL